MTKPTCPKCGSTNFQTTLQNVSGLNYPMTFIHCSKCGCTINVVEEFNISQFVRAIAKKVGITDVDAYLGSG